MKKNLKRVLLLALAIAVVRPLFAVEGSQVQLRSSTIPGATAGVIGELDLTVPDAIFFRAPNASQINIPYKGITEFSFQQEVAHHVGVLPAVAISLVKKRERQHFLSLTFQDSSNTIQVVPFEISKKMPDVLLAVLRARARSACERQGNFCRPVVPPPPPVRPGPASPLHHPVDGDAITSASQSQSGNPPF